MAKHKQTSKDEADQILESVQRAPAVFTKDQAITGNDVFDKMAYIRRIASIIVTYTGAELIELIGKERASAVAFAAWLDHVDEYRGKLQAALEILDAAKIRTVVALACRDDMDAITREAQASDSAAVIR